MLVSSYKRGLVCRKFPASEQETSSTRIKQNILVSAVKNNKPFYLFSIWLARRDTANDELQKPTRREQIIMYFSTKVLGLLSLSAMFSLSLAKPMPQGGYAVPAGNGGNGDCAGSDGKEHSDVLACPAHPEAVAELCHDNPWEGDNCSGGVAGSGPMCLNGNFCTGDMHGETKSGEESIGYYNKMGCNCDG